MGGGGRVGSSLTLCRFQASGPQGPVHSALHPAELSRAADTRNTSVPSPPRLILERPAPLSGGL